MRRWWMKNFFNERNRARRLSLSIMKELKIKNKTASNIDFLNTINAIEFSRARCRNITTFSSIETAFFLFFPPFFFFLHSKSKTRLNSFLKTVLSSRESMVKYEIRHSVANWKYGMEYLLSRHLFFINSIAKENRN